MSTLYVDTIAEKTAGNGVQIPGHVVQVVSAAMSSAVTNSTQAWVDTSLSASITPSSSNSKILVLVTHPAIVTRTVSDNWLGGIKLLRDSTVIGNGANYTMGQTHQNGTLSGSGATWWWWTSHELDSPATTSSITYKTQSYADSSGSVTASTKGRMTLMEIAQ